MVTASLIRVFTHSNIAMAGSTRLKRNSQTIPLLMLTILNNINIITPHKDNSPQAQY